MTADLKSVARGLRESLRSGARNPLGKFSSKKLGTDPTQIRFTEDLSRFVEAGGSVTNVWPITSDFDGNASGVLPGHYFNQDLHVASLISKSTPRRHIDVGSSFAGFVAHVASFREIEVLDIRPMDALDHPQISFLQKDLAVPDPNFRGITDSLSCLHTIEHFGLGRYGDSIDPDGHLKGFQNLVDLLEPGGTLYISFPIGKEDAVHFNAHRVFHPLSILDWPLSDGHLELKEFSYEDNAQRFHRDVPLGEFVPNVEYGCGIYTFQKS